MMRFIQDLSALQYLGYQIDGQRVDVALQWRRLFGYSRRWLGRTIVGCRRPKDEQFLGASPRKGAYNRDMSKVDEQFETDLVSQENAKHLLRMSELDRVLSLAVKEAQEENRRLGIPNYYEIDGRIVSDQD